MSYKYILNGKTPVPEPDLKKWSEWMASADRHVADTMVGEVRVSTVFIGLDHEFMGGPPRLFETMVFGGALDQEYLRCSTYEEAEAQHAEMCTRLSNMETNSDNS